MNGDLNATSVILARGDAEDGEIDDAQSTAAASKSGAKALPTPKSDQSATPPASQKPLQAPIPSNSTAPPANNEGPLSTVTIPSTSDNANQVQAISSQKPPPIPHRPDLNRTTPSSLINGHHDLPNRPEAPNLPRGDTRMPQRGEDRPLPMYPRDSRFQGRGGLDGQRDAPNGRGVERDAPGSGPPFHHNGQTEERLSRPGYEDGYGNAISRDIRSLPLNDRDSRLSNRRPMPDSDLGRRDFGSGQRARDHEMPPPRSTIPQHPDRAALIHGHPEPDRNQPLRYSNDRPSQSNSEGYPQGNLQNRSEERGPLYDRNRTVQDTRPPYDDRSSQGRYEDSHASSVPRNDRPPFGHPNSSNERFREGMRPSLATRTSSGSEHGRLRADSLNNRQSESSYGRLNDVPSGPRLSNGSIQGPTRGARNPSALGPPQNQQPTATNQRPPSPPASRAAPNTPSIRSSPRQQNAPALTNSGPSTPVSQGPETAGIHPDRLRAMQGVGPANVSTGPPVQGASRQPPSPVGSVPVGPPRGPHGQLQNPGAQAPLGRGPPTGPADRGRSDKRFTSLQSVLQQSDQNGADRSNQGTSIRGRGGRPSNLPSPSTSGPPTPGTLRPDSFATRDDLFVGRANGAAGPPVNEEDGRYERGARRGPPELERRTGRHRSRSAGKDRPMDGRMQDEDRGAAPPRDNARDRFRHEGPAMNIRGGAGQDLRGPPPDVMERDFRGGAARRGERDDLGPRESMHRESQDWSGERRGGPGRRGEERDSRDGGSMRKRGRPGDDGFGERVMMDSKRPRR